MKIIGCDLHARQQTIAMLDTDTGEFVEKTLEHDGEELRKFYSGLSRPVLVGIGVPLITEDVSVVMSFTGIRSNTFTVYFSLSPP
jgi:hypothetical protein